MNSFEEVFENVKKYCLENNKIPAIGVKTWIDPLTPVDFNGENAVFSVGTDFQKNIVMTTYASILSEAFLNVLGLNVNIIINVESDEPVSGQVPTDATRKMPSLKSHINSQIMTIPSIPSLRVPLTALRLPAVNPLQKTAENAKFQAIIRCLYTVRPEWEKPTLSQLSQTKSEKITPISILSTLPARPSEMTLSPLSRQISSPIFRKNTAMLISSSSTIFSFLQEKNVCRKNSSIPSINSIRKANR